MARVLYTVEFVAGAWTVGLNGRRFGPYSSMETALAAAMAAGHKAEAQGYEAEVKVCEAPPPAAESNAA